MKNRLPEQNGVRLHPAPYVIRQANQVEGSTTRLYRDQHTEGLAIGRRASIARDEDIELPPSASTLGDQCSYQPVGQASETTIVLEFTVAAQ